MCDTQHQLTAEDYDAHQSQGGIQCETDDICHSSQRLKKPVAVDFERVRKGKERMLKQARKRGVTLGVIYRELDDKYTAQALANAAKRKQRRKTKKNRVGSLNEGE
jgi:hypothetical protein